MQLSDRILKQVQVTLNLLRASRINPRLSAHAQLHGDFDFNRTLLGPLGTRIISHNSPGKRKSWAPTVTTHGISVPHCFTTNATKRSSLKRKHNALPKPPSGSPHTLPCQKLRPLTPQPPLSPNYSPQSETPLLRSPFPA